MVLIELLNFLAANPPVVVVLGLIIGLILYATGIWTPWAVEEPMLERTRLEQRKKEKEELIEYQAAKAEAAARAAALEEAFPELYDDRTYNQKAGDALENFVIRIFENRGYATTKEYDKYGIDILATKHGSRIGIQCKNYREERVMTDWAVMDYVERIGKWRMSIDEMILICTGGFESFSPFTILDCGDHINPGFSMEQWDRNILEEEANKEGMSWLDRTW